MCLRADGQDSPGLDWQDERGADRIGVVVIGLAGVERHGQERSRTGKAGTETHAMAR